MSDVRTQVRELLSDAKQSSDGPALKLLTGDDRLATRGFGHVDGEIAAIEFNERTHTDLETRVGVGEDRVVLSCNAEHWRVGLQSRLTVEQQEQLALALAQNAAARRQEAEKDD